MSQGLRMVHLRTVPDALHAKVLAARLGSEGIVTHLQGGVAGPYPFGAVSVRVEAEQADLAAELLLADEVEAAFASHAGWAWERPPTPSPKPTATTPSPTRPRTPPMRRWRPSGGRRDGDGRWPRWPLCSWLAYPSWHTSWASRRAARLHLVAGR